MPDGSRRVGYPIFVPFRALPHAQECLAAISGSVALISVFSLSVASAMVFISPEAWYLTDVTVCCICTQGERNVFASRLLYDPAGLRVVGKEEIDVKHGTAGRNESLRSDPFLPRHAQVQQPVPLFELNRADIL